MNRLLIVLAVLPLFGCASAPSKDAARECATVGSILAREKACAGNRLSLSGYMTFTRHGIMIADNQVGDEVISVRISSGSEHRASTTSLIAFVRSLPVRTTRTVHGHFEGILIWPPGEKPIFEVFSGTDLVQGD